MHARTNAPRPRAASLPAAQVQGAARTRSTSVQQPPVHLEETARMRVAHTRLQEALHQADGLIPHELLEKLTGFAAAGGKHLDLTDEGQFLRRLELSDLAIEAVALGGVMAALANVCATSDAAPTTLVLPPGLGRLPGWVTHFGSINELHLPQFRGRQLDARGLKGLGQLHLGEMPPRELTICTPPGCQLTITHPDGRNPVLVTTERRQHRLVQLKWRALNFNGRIDRNHTKGVFVCRHLSLGKIRGWAEAGLMQLLTEPMGSGEDVREDMAELVQNIPLDADDISNKLDHRPRRAYLVAHARWNDFALHQFSQMKQEGRASAVAFVVATSTHAMAMRFDASDPQRRRIELWDPNFTDISTFCHEPFKFEAMFVDFERIKQAYFGVGWIGKNVQPLGTAQHIKIVMIDDPLDPAGSVASKRDSCDVSADFAGLPATAHPDLARELVEHGFCRRGMEQLVNAIETLPLTRDQCIALVTAADANQVPALNRAAEVGHGLAYSDTALLLRAAFRKNLLVETDVRAVLEGRGSFGTALASAYQSGNHAAVTDFARAARSLHKAGALSQRSVYHLVRAANADRAPTIHHIKDLKTAKSLEKALKKLLGAGALTKDDYKDLMSEVEDRQIELRDQVKEQKREARRQPALDPMTRV